MWSTKEASYLFRKRGVFYYSRRVPKDLWGLFRRQRVVFSLRTKAHAKALKIASRVSLKLEDQWQGLRWQHCDQVLEQFTSVLLAAPAQPPVYSSGPLLSKAAETYLAGKGSHRPKRFRQAVDRAVSNMVEVGGDLPIGSYTRSQVNSLRDKLQSSGLATASVRRQLSNLSALVNYVSKELGLDPNPAFSGVIIHEVEVDAEIQKRPSVLVRHQSIWAS